MKNNNLFKVFLGKMTTKAILVFVVFSVIFTFTPVHKTEASFMDSVASVGTTVKNIAVSIYDFFFQKPQVVIVENTTFETTTTPTVPPPTPSPVIIRNTTTTNTVSEDSIIAIVKKILSGEEYYQRNPQSTPGPRGERGSTGATGPEGPQGSTPDLGNYVTYTSYERQVEGLLRSIENTSESISESIATEVSTALLNVSGTGSFGTSITTPLIQGGIATTSDLTFKTTAGVGEAGADMHFLVGSNGATEAMTILNDGRVGIGTTEPGYYDDEAQLAIKSTNPYGLYIDGQYGGAGDIMGVYALVTVPDTKVDSVTYLSGGSFFMDNYSTGNVIWETGVDAYAYHNGPGTATNSAGIRVYDAIYGGAIVNSYGVELSIGNYGGTITNTYGVYIGDVTGGIQTNQAYGLYQVDSGARNYFAGNVGIGTTNPGNKLTVTAPTTADILSDVIIGTSATTQKGLVIQGKLSQTANLQEWQNSSGNVLAKIVPNDGFYVINPSDSTRYVKIVSVGTDKVSIIGNVHLDIGTTALPSSISLFSPTLNGTWNLGNAKTAFSLGSAPAVNQNGGLISEELFFSTSSGYSGSSLRFNGNSINFGPLGAGVGGTGNGGNFIVIPGPGDTSGSNGKMIVKMPSGTYVGGNLQEWQNSSGTPMTVISATGNVGIGTISPNNILSVTPTQYETGTVSQSGTTLTGVGTTFTSSMVGSQVVYSNGTTASVFAFVDATHLTVTPSQTVASQAYKIVRIGFQVGSSGNIGIGTLTPNSPLQIARILNDDGNILTLGNDTSNVFNFSRASSTGALLIQGTQVNNNNILLAPTSGNVGIGITNPSSRLTVLGDGTNILIGSGAAVSAGYGGISLNGTMDTTNYNFLSSGSDKNLYINSPSDVVIRSGNNANEELVLNSINFTAKVEIASNFSSILGAWGAFPTLSASNSSTATHSFAGVRIAGNNNTVVGGFLSDGLGTGELISGNGAGVVLYTETNHPIIFGTNSTEVARLSTSGFLGIGTTNPLAKLDIQGGGNSNVALPDIAFQYGANGGFRHFIATKHDTAAGNGNAIEFFINTSGTNGGSTAPGTGNINVMGIYGNGNVGIGTTAPNEKLDVNGAIQFRGVSTGYGTTQSVGMIDYANLGTRFLSFGADAGTKGIFSWFQSGQNNTAGLEVMRITDTGSLAINTTFSTWNTVPAKVSILGNKDLTNAIGNQLTIVDGTAVGTGVGGGIMFAGRYDGENSAFSGGIDTYKSNATAGNYGFDLRFLNRENGVAPLQERMRITSTGFVGIGLTNPSVALDVTGDIEYTGTITDVSDRRLKENISDFTGALNIITNLQAKNYNMIGDDRYEVGFLAQDVNDLFPSATSIIDKERGYLGVSYVSLVPIVSQAVRELNLNLESIATPLDLQDEKSFSDRFFSRLALWMADAGNGIGDIFSNRVRTKEICVEDEGGQTCLNRSQLDALILNTGTSIPTNGTSSPTSDSAPEEPVVPPEPEPEITEPGVTILEENALSQPVSEEIVSSEPVTTVPESVATPAISE